MESSTNGYNTFETRVSPCTQAGWPTCLLPFHYALYFDIWHAWLETLMSVLDSTRATRSGYCPWFQALRRTTRWVILRRQKGDSAWSAAVEASWTMAGARTSVKPFGQSAVFNQISAGLRTKPFLPENITCFYSSTILLASLWKAVLGPPSANFELSFRLVYDTGFLCGALAVLAFTM